jgi:hypothetical protein
LTGHDITMSFTDVGFAKVICEAFAYLLLFGICSYSDP